MSASAVLISAALLSADAFADQAAASSAKAVQAPAKAPVDSGRAMGYLSGHFKGPGFSTRLQTFAHKDMTTGKRVDMTGIIATVPGKDAKRKPVVFCAHWDTRPGADMEAGVMMKNRPIIGANDGASGVAVVMELGNVLKRTPPPQTVYLVLFDGEDYGHEGNIEEYFLGARHFAENPPARDMAYALLFDMVGDRDLDLPMEQNSLKQSPERVRKIRARAASLGLNAFEPRIGPYVLDDHIPLQAKGIPAVDVIDFEYPHRHTLAGTPDKCPAHSLGVAGGLAESLALGPP